MSVPTADSAVLPPRHLRWFDWGLVVLVLALAGGCAYFGLQWRDLRAERAAGADAVAVGKAQVIGLTTLDEKHIDPQLASLRARTTGDFRRQFDGIADTFASVVRKDHIVAHGKVVAAGLVHRDSARASVLVASSASVRSAGAKAGPTERNYRMLVQLVRVGETWMVSGMEFVA
jgi:Mce-associated membrane protein